MKFKIGIFESAREILSARHEPERLRTLADLYWRALLSIAFAALIFVFWYATQEFLGVLNDLAASPAGPAAPHPALDRNTLDAAVQALEARQARFQDLTSNPPAPIPDPSQ